MPVKFFRPELVEKSCSFKIEVIHLKDCTLMSGSLRFSVTHQILLMCLLLLPNL